MYVLDQYLQPVPIGTVGELHIAGDGVAVGYLNRPELTVGRFIPDPFSAAGQRMYKTGDLARHLPDGTLECLGRIDLQVKIRGFRVEPGEVESVLCQHRSIAEALVTARDDALGEKRLIGYIISRNGPPPIQDLRDFAKTKLPLYMVPSHFVVLKQFPLTPNGKIDLGRLPSPDEATAQPPRSYLPPRSPEEQTLASIWQEVLLLKQIGVDENFFELGGDSLSATRVFARINRSFGTELTLREILEHPTIQRLGDLISKAPTTSNRRSVIPRQSRTIQIVT
jgi:acyl carrier protein